MIDIDGDSQQMRAGGRGYGVGCLPAGPGRGSPSAAGHMEAASALSRLLWQVTVLKTQRQGPPADLSKCLE